MHVHLVFVTKYRRCMLDGEAIEKLRRIFSKVCTDFEAGLVQMDGEGNHVHLLVNYPPKVSVSSLVNSLKGVSSYVLRRQLPRITKGYWTMYCGRLPTSPLPVAAHRSTSSTLPRAASDTVIVGAYPVLNSGACATRWSRACREPVLGRRRRMVWRPGVREAVRAGHRRRGRRTRARSSHRRCRCSCDSRTPQNGLRTNCLISSRVMLVSGMGFPRRCNWLHLKDAREASPTQQTKRAGRNSADSGILAVRRGRAFEVAKGKLEAPIFRMVVVSDGEGDVDRIAGKKLGSLEPFRHVPAEGVERHIPAPSGVFLCRSPVLSYARRSLRPIRWRRDDKGE